MSKVRIKQKNCEILENRQIATGFFKMKIKAPAIAHRASPGQFVNIRCSKGVNPLLRRPLSFHRINKGDFEILYKVVGPGTRLLSEKKKGDYIDILGPLGNGFNLRRTTHDARRTTILVAGGMGVAPLLALAEKLKRQKPLVLIGAKTQKEIVGKADFQKLGCRVKVATDDGSAGFKGFVSQLLQKVLRTTHDPPSPRLRRAGARRLPAGQAGTTVFTCGPKPMLQAIAEICRRHKIPAYASMEEYMACGVGACLSCVIRLRGQKGHQRVCVDGPVFNLGEVIW